MAALKSDACAEGRGLRRADPDGASARFFDIDGRRLEEVGDTGSAIRPGFAQRLALSGEDGDVTDKLDMHSHNTWDGIEAFWKWEVVNVVIVKLHKRRNVCCRP